VDEDYPARPEIKQSLTGWGDNCGSESSILETDVCVWRYAPIVVHATQEEEEEEHNKCQVVVWSVVICQYSASQSMKKPNWTVILSVVGGHA